MAISLSVYRKTCNQIESLCVMKKYGDAFELAVPLSEGLVDSVSHNIPDYLEMARLSVVTESGRWVQYVAERAKQTGWVIFNEDVPPIDTSVRKRNAKGHFVKGD